MSLLRVYNTVWTLY